MIDLTREEELINRRKNFTQLATGFLFDLGQQRWFIAIKKIDDEWEVIELTEDNRQKIIMSQVCEITRLHFDNMHCLNLR